MFFEGKRDGIRMWSVLGYWFCSFLFICDCFFLIRVAVGAASERPWNTFGAVSEWHESSVGLISDYFLSGMGVSLLALVHRTCNDFGHACGRDEPHDHFHGSLPLGWLPSIHSSRSPSLHPGNLIVSTLGFQLFPPWDSNCFHPGSLIVSTLGV